MYILPLYNYIFICLYKNIPTLKYRIGIKYAKEGSVKVFRTYEGDLQQPLYTVR